MDLFVGMWQTDHPEYLKLLYEKILSQEELKLLQEKHKINTVDEFIIRFQYQKICPRKIFNYPSGQRLDICNCAHAERNALASANLSGICTKNSIMFCYCGIPCWECSQQIIQAGVKTLICLKKDKDYTPSSRYFLYHSGIEVIEVEDPT